MNSRPRWSYVQARLQSRHGERLQEADWQAVEAARSMGQYLEHARALPLRRFIAHIDVRMSSHAIERVLREIWRRYVAEVAGWVPAGWRQAVLWTALVPDLPIIAAVLRADATVAWIQQDPVFAKFADPDPRKRDATLTASPFARLLAVSESDETLAARWFAHWRSLWPHRRGGERELLEIAVTISAHVERLRRAGALETSAPHRRDLALKLARMFRRRSGTPAVFCHLALVAIDLERLRGGLLRRLLFNPGGAKEAA